MWGDDDTDAAPSDDGLEDGTGDLSAYPNDLTDSGDSADDWPETPSAWPPGILDDPNAADPTSGAAQNPWIMPQVGILDPDAEAQLSAYQDRMNGVQQLLSQLYPMTNGPSTLTGDPTTDLINDPYYHDPSDYDDDPQGPLAVNPFQPGVVTTDGRLIPDPVGDPAAPSGFGSGFSPQPLSAIIDPNAGQVVAPTPLFQGADTGNIQPAALPQITYSTTDLPGASDGVHGADAGVEEGDAEQPSAIYDGMNEGSNSAGDDPQGVRYRTNPYPTSANPPPSSMAARAVQWALFKTKNDPAGYSEHSFYNGPNGEYGSVGHRFTPGGVISLPGWNKDKCNWFVADALRNAGFDKASLFKKNGELLGAHDYADPSVTIPGLAVVTDGALQEGDIIALAHGPSGGHVGIYHVNDEGVPGVISANGDVGVRFNKWPFNDPEANAHYVVRRLAPH